MCICTISNVISLGFMAYRPLGYLMPKSFYSIYYSVSYIILRETKSLLIAAQNNAIRTNYIKARIDKTKQNNKWRLCDERNEMINHISECSELAQKENKSWYD